MSLIEKLDFRAFLNDIQAPLIVFSEEGELFFNRYFKENIETQGTKWTDFFTSPDIRHQIERYFSEGILPKRDFKSTLLHKSQGEVTYLWSFTDFPNPGERRICAAKGTANYSVVEKLNQQILGKESGAQNQEDFRFIANVLRYSHDMLAILDRNGIYKFISSAVIEKLGVNPANIIGKSYLDFVKQRVIEVEEGDVREVFSSKEEVNINFWINTPSGKRVFIESYSRNLLDDPLVDGILFSARDITEYWYAKKSLQKRYELENLINRISAKFVNAGYDQVDQVFRSSLKMLGEFEDADRAYIFLVHEAIGEIENVYEWTAEGIEPQIEYLKHIPITDQNLTLEAMKGGQILVVPDVDLMPDEFEIEKKIYQEQGIQSFVLIPIFSENKLIGFFGMDAVRSKRDWNEKDEFVLRQLGDIYAGSFINRAIKKRLERNENLLASTEILAKSGSWRFSNSQKRIFFSAGLKKIFEFDENLYSDTVTGFLQAINKKDRKSFLQNLRHAVRRKSTTAGEFEIKPKSGRLKFISYTIQVRPIPDTDKVEVFGYCSDVTHKKDAENYLKLQSQILAQVNDPIFVTDSNLRIIYVNNSGLRECKLREDQVLEEKFDDLFEFKAAENGCFVSRVKDLAADASIREMVEISISGTGFEPHEVSVQPFLNDEKVKIGYSFVLRNLSLQVKQEALAKKAQMIVENSPAILFTVDPNQDFQILYITDNIRQFGYNASELVQSKKSILELIHPDDARNLLDFHFAKKSKAGVPAYSGEYRFLKSDGSYRWVEDKSVETLDENGNIISHEGIIQDITERKNSREKVLRSEERYRVLASNIPGTSIFLIDRDLRYIVAQGTNFADWGMTAADFEGKTLAEVHRRNLNEIQPVVIKALLKNEIQQKHIIFKKRVYEITVKPITYDGEVEYALGILRDINEEFQAKEDLRKNEEKYRRLVEESTEIIFSLGMNMKFTYISPNVRQFLGYKPEDVLSRALTEFLHPEDLAVMSQEMKQGSDFFKYNQYLEFRLRHLNGEYRIFSSNGKLVSDDEGKGLYYTGIARDITKLKEAQRELLLAKERAEQASTIKSQFLSIMSHEIRTPMNAVIGMAHLLIEDNPRPDQLENLKTLQFSAENLLGLINDILDYTKIDSGKVELEKVSFELENVFQRILHSYSYQAREKALDVIFEIDPAIPKSLLGDPVRLGQVVNNLVSNAVKFTEKGYIRIKLSNVGEKKDRVSVRFDFEDTGIGIPEEKLDLVFEAFTQASAATTRKYGGTGLGLAIVRRLVQLFGSDIKAYRRQEGGTRFTFTITFARPSTDEKVSPQGNTEGLRILQDANILIAEDNIVNQIMIKKFLTKWGVHQVVIANDGNEAIEAFSKQDFNIILLDLQMPEKDGFQVAEYIRKLKDPKKNQVPIIALTASSLIEVKEHLEEVGMNDYISKPFNPDHLYTKIIKYLQG